MALTQATLIKKISLTDDIFELHYTLSEIKPFTAGQFITFILSWIGWRAYSILEIKDETIVLVIKRWSIEMWGRWGSIFLCDALVWDVFSCVWPAGHFVLSAKNTSRLFLGTGTGLVPLYSHICEWLKWAWNHKYQLVFWVRSKQDLYYLQRFEELKNKYPSTFFYHLMVSRDSAEGIIHHGYVTDFLNEKTILDFEEYYICGAPAMIESCEKKLLELKVPIENIFFEKYA